jgi:ubiquinone/menaquinone biosynthesis C-methylase UbiE
LTCVDYERVCVSEYYTRKLSATRLKQVYDIASPRIMQYLDAELDHVLEKIRPGAHVIELGCGYGRVLPKLAGKAGWVIGIDTSVPTLKLAQEVIETIPNCSLFRMDAVTLGFNDRTFDCVVCIQNGISAFHVDQRALISESVRVTRSDGIVLFSSYSDKFWKHRLKWFKLQSEAGLIGEIDYEKTKNGVIVCKDGFIATTARSMDFLALTAHLNADVQIVEIDESSTFCEIAPKEEKRRC